MALLQDKKKKVIQDYQENKKDTGSADVQVALITEQLNALSEHFKAHPKDHHSRYGLIKMVSRRKRLLAYIQREDQNRYKKLITRLELRK